MTPGSTDRAGAEPEGPPLLEERAGGVHVLTFNRPGRLNAWTDELGERYARALGEADADPEVRAIVLTGAGRGFCAGLDVAQLREPRERTPAEREEAARTRTAALRVRKPMVAAINGPAAGLGLLQALYCDVRIAEADAKLTTSFARLGLVAEGGSSWILPRLVGHGRAAELLLSGRIVLGEEAAAIGLVERVSAPGQVLAEAVAYARELAERCSPTVMAAIKAQLRRDASSSLAGSLYRSQLKMLDAFDWPDQQEGARALAERRPPRFPPLGPVQRPV
jgi:enoyl-CoA hydratase/carnithine racemase